VASLPFFRLVLWRISVSGKAKRIWLVLALVSMIMFLVAMPLYKKYNMRAFKEASAALIERTQKAVEKNPQLKADYDKAIQEDGALSWPKANAILEKAGEKPDPEPAN
jgi:Tfp pilus assembly protein PilE